MNLFSTNPVSQTAVSQTNPTLQRVVPIIFSVVLLTAVLFLMQTQPAAAAVDCNDSSWQVGDEADLNAAIVCYNSKPAGSYAISLTQSISLTTSTTPISNTVASVTLLLEGG
ncbi:MAG: hypothetical protein GY805_20150, partial [Chloroflexi bacterium]|nr:hypothetical protein [Chloroflexota bacterium]